ncbi:MAG: hypothetical protein PHF37_06410 [Phycisphaerae bacterium]|nr:hypothetical protein [Phycisphaerae bacterium]
MSSKINVIGIIIGHIVTLKNTDDKISIADCATFFGIPLAISMLSLFFGYGLSSGVYSLLVNFGSIFTALLLSVLVLVYEQESKIEVGKGLDPLYKAKKELLNQLYYNISYSIILSIVLVISCLLGSIIDGKPFFVGFGEYKSQIKFDVYLFTPISLFITSNVILTIVMIVKRVHALLTIK